MGPNSFITLGFAALMCSVHVLCSSHHLDIQMFAGRSMYLQGQNVTLRGPSERIPRLDIKNCTVNQKVKELWYLANRINIIHTVINISQNQTLGMDAFSIQLSNSTLNLTGNARLIVSSKSVTFENNTLYLDLAILKISKPRVKRFEFLGNDFSNSTFDVLTLADEFWSFVNNTFACPCPPKRAPLHLGPWGDKNFCNFKGCVVTLSQFDRAVGDKRLCTAGNDHENVKALCSK